MIQSTKSILKKHFGYDNFRPKQEEIINSIIDNKDTVVLMPTGGGKSICFQIPALYKSGIALVISPLISLMKDQVEALRSNGIPAAYYNSTQSSDQSNNVIRKAQAGELKLLYMSPETLVSTANSWLHTIDLSMVAVDEAHCASMWGHDFRPEYKQLKHFREKLRNIPFVALTATADKTTRNDIIKQIGLKNPQIFISSFDRPNLSLDVRPNVKKKDKIKEIRAFISSRPNDCGIIYCLSRKGTEEMAKELKSFGFDAKAYHAGIPADKRSKVQEDFINDRSKIICATIAFGMGIDKSNVRWVIHNNLPKNIESFYQEIGRAGRDGIDSKTILYYNLRDIMVLSQFARKSELKDILIEKLNRMQQYAEATSCRRRLLLSYFGEHLDKNCGNCDVCKNPPQRIEGTVIAQKALSAIYRLNQNVGSTMLINVLRGSHNSDLLAKGYQNVKTFGAGKDISFNDWQQYLAQFLNLGLVEIAYDESFTLKLTQFGIDVLYGKMNIALTKPLDRKAIAAESKKKKSKKSGHYNLSPNEALYEELRELRKELAALEKVPAYIIFHDKTLKEISATKPKTKEALLSVQGISEVKFEKYGEALLLLMNSKSTKKKDTYKETLQLYLDGLTPDEIADARGIKVDTIYSHFCKLFEDGKPVDLKEYVKDFEIDAIKKAKAQIKDTSALRPYFDFFDGKLSYGKIRMGLVLIGND